MPISPTDLVVGKMHNLSSLPVCAYVKVTKPTQYSTAVMGIYPLPCKSVADLRPTKRSNVSDAANRIREAGFELWGRESTTEAFKDMSDQFGEFNLHTITGVIARMDFPGLYATFLKFFASLYAQRGDSLYRDLPGSGKKTLFYGFAAYANAFSLYKGDMSVVTDNGHLSPAVAKLLTDSQYTNVLGERLAKIVDPPAKSYEHPLFGETPTRGVSGRVTLTVRAQDTKTDYRIESSGPNSVSITRTRSDIVQTVYIKTTGAVMNRPFGGILAGESVARADELVIDSTQSQSRLLWVARVSAAGRRRNRTRAALAALLGHCLASKQGAYVDAELRKNRNDNLNAREFVKSFVNDVFESGDEYMFAETVKNLRFTIRVSQDVEPTTETVVDGLKGQHSMTQREILDINALGEPGTAAAIPAREPPKRSDPDNKSDDGTTSHDESSSDESSEGSDESEAAGAGAQDLSDPSDSEAEGSSDSSSSDGSTASALSLHSDKGGSDDSSSDEGEDVNDGGSLNGESSPKDESSSSDASSSSSDDAGFGGVDLGSSSSGAEASGTDVLVGSGDSESSDDSDDSDTSVDPNDNYPGSESDSESD